MLLIGRGGSCCSSVFGRFRRGPQYLPGGPSPPDPRAAGWPDLPAAGWPAGSSPDPTPLLLVGRIPTLLVGRRGTSGPPRCCWLAGPPRCWVGWVGRFGDWAGRGWWRLAEKRLRALRFARNGNGRVEARVITC